VAIGGEDGKGELSCCLWLLGCVAKAWTVEEVVLVLLLEKQGERKVRRRGIGKGRDEGEVSESEFSNSSR
jgi:hypothetical protein